MIILKARKKKSPMNHHHRRHHLNRYERKRKPEWRRRLWEHEPQLRPAQRLRHARPVGQGRPAVRVERHGVF